MSEFDNFVPDDWNSTVSGDLPSPTYCRMTSQTSDDVISYTMDRTMSISLEELMENIKVPQSDTNRNERPGLFEVCEDLKQFNINRERNDRSSRSTVNSGSNEGRSGTGVQEPVLILENHTQTKSVADLGDEHFNVICVRRSSNDSNSIEGHISRSSNVSMSSEGRRTSLNDKESATACDASTDIVKKLDSNINEGHIVSMLNEGHTSSWDEESNWMVERESWSDDVTNLSDSECFSLTIEEEPFSRSNEENDSSNNCLDSVPNERYDAENDLTFTEGQTNIMTELEIVEPYQRSNDGGRRSNDKTLTNSNDDDGVELEDYDNSRSNRLFINTKNVKTDQNEDHIIRENQSTTEENHSAVNNLSIINTESILSESHCKDNNSTTNGGSNVIGENHSCMEETQSSMTLLSKSGCSPGLGSFEIGENRSGVANLSNSLHEDLSVKDDTDQGDCNDLVISEQLSLQNLFHDRATVNNQSTTSGCVQSTTNNLSTGELKKSGDDAQSGSMMQEAQEKTPPVASNTSVKLSRPRRAKEIHLEVLSSGFLTSPGCYDLNRRPILYVDGNVTRSQHFRETEYARLMLYLVSTFSFITILVDVRNISNGAWNFIKETILLFQWNRPGVISRIILFTDDEDFSPDTNAFNSQCDVIPDIRQLLEFVDEDNLLVIYGGKFKYNHEKWIEDRLELESYVLLCEMLQHNFTRSTVTMSTATMPTALHETAEMLNHHRSTMTELLDDPRVRDLHPTSHRLLQGKVKEETAENRSYAEQIRESYESVCSAIQRYVQVADERLLALERHLLVKQFEESCDRILSWASDRTSELQSKFGKVAESLVDLRTQRHEFDKFYLEVVKQYAQCDCLLSEADQLSSSGFLGQVNSQARNAAERISQVVRDMETKKEEVETASHLYQFVDQAYSWALTGMKFVASLSMTGCMTAEACQAQIDKYDEYMTRHPPILNERFAEMSDVAIRYNNIKCQRQCEIAQQKCNETCELFKKRRKLLVKAKEHLEEGMKRRTSTRNTTNMTQQDISSSKQEPKVRTIVRRNSDITNKQSHSQGGSNNNNNCGMPTDDGPTETADIPTSEPVMTKHRPKKMLRKSASMISHSSGTQRLKIGAPMQRAEKDTKGRSKSSLAIEELLSTEEEYVRSLNYIIEHYYPLMNQLDDVPQSLRGTRGVIFGNIENIRDFHAGTFLDSLRGCQDNAGKVAESFIQHIIMAGNLTNNQRKWKNQTILKRENFSLYALYSKNKPKSDELMKEQGTKFFLAKQQQLRDKMDLASYLLKPVQRMGKYSLLLHNISKHSEMRFRGLLREAESLVKFQLRHGNDLLAMDSIVDCPLNLKEQGELKRQDEFIVFRGRRKFLRHVFLFEELVLFGKPQRIHGGHDLYHYKSSHKMSEVGLTENIGETGLKFEIWFRRPMQDSIVLYSATEQKKVAWVEDVRNILWKQAMRNRENRRSEMVNMGIGSKPFLDIRSSQSPITDRSVAAELMGGRILSSRSRASIAVATFDHASKRPHSTVSTSSTSSNGSVQLASHQPASMFDFRAIAEDEEFESGSGHGSSLCTSNEDTEPIEGAHETNDAKPQQYITTV